MSLTELFLQYGLFFLKTATVVIAVLFVVANSVAAMMRAKKSEGILVIEKLNAKFDTARHTIQREVLSKSAYKKVLKAEKKEHKQQLKQQSGAADGNPRQRLFVICFDGDIKASAVEALRHQVNAILLSATSADEVVVILESPGGVVHGYGLAASQLHRFKDNKIKLTVAVDKVAASGGYMMACVADHIMAAPFAILGSIGVVAQIPNFHRWLQDRNVDIEHFTAGEYKRTLTLLAENTEKGRHKFKEELEETHDLFKAFVKDGRPQLDLEKVATGEHWYGTQALDLGLIDALQTSDDYLLQASKNADLFLIDYKIAPTVSQRLAHVAQQSFTALWQKISHASLSARYNRWL